MRKARYIIIILLIGFAAWTLGGGISASREKIVPQALWNAVSTNDQDKTDTDKDGLIDMEEKKLGTDPNKADTDGDGFLDGQEVKNGYDPLKLPPGDRTTNSNGNSNNNTNSPATGTGLNPTSIGNGNQNNNQNGIVINTSSGSAEKPDSAEPYSKENVTDKVALKVDEIIAKYKLYSAPYNTLGSDTRAEIEKNLNEFSEGILKNTGLDFAFNIPRENLKLIETEGKEKNQYLSRAKDILRKHNFISDSQTIEDGLRAILLDLSNMSKKDIDWGKTNNWKREIDPAYKELLKMPVNPTLEAPHVRLLRIVNSLQIVLGNLNEGDYFRSFLAAGRAEKINSELDKFSEEIK